MPVEIADPAAIAAIVGTVLAAPVAPGRVRSDYAERAPHMYRLIYVLEDGTRAGDWVFGDLNQTDSGILLPSGFHGLVQRAATGAPLRVVEAYDVAFRSERVTIAAGIPVTIEVANTGALPHNFTVDGLGVSVDAAPGETGSATVTAPAGSYRFFCNVPGHKDAGMVGTLIAEAQPPATPEPQAE